MKRLIFIYLAFSLVLSASVGLLQTPDSFFYASLGEYLTHGTILPAFPFNATTPSTLFAPVYPLAIKPLTDTRALSGMLTVPLTQLLLLGFSALLLYRITNHLLPKSLRIFLVALFLLLPYNIVYATLYMSEVLAQFLIIAIVYLFSKRIHPAVLVFISSILVLTRYAYISLFGLSLLLWILRRGKIKDWKHVFALCGFSLLLLWGWFNYSTNGRFSLSSVTGRHLFNNVVVLGRLIPNKESEVYQDFVRHFPQEAMTYRPWWENDVYFHFLKEAAADELYLRFSVEAIKTHPVAYAGNVVKTMLVTPATAPYHEKAWQQDLSSCKNSWRFHWSSLLGSPVMPVCWVNRAWAVFLAFQSLLYPAIGVFLIIPAIIGIGGMLVSRSPLLKSVAFTFLVTHAFNSATEWIEGRFLIPLYPLYAIAIVYGIYVLLTSVHAIIIAFRTNGRLPKILL